MSQSFNLCALQWAYEQEGLSATMKDVLMSFAIHANECGYTWPGVDHIAFTWNLDRRTVRRQIEALLVRRKICRTNKTRGATGQVKVYRLPKTVWGSGAFRHRFEKDQSGDKAGHKRSIRGAPVTPNNIIINREERRISDQGAAKTFSTSIPNTPSNAPDSFSSGKYQYQNTAARDHPKWLEFADYCRSQGGEPTKKGFDTWLSKQRPQWRNKIRPKPGGEKGYVLEGKFYPVDEANRMAEKNSELALKFRPVIRRDIKA